MILAGPEEASLANQVLRHLSILKRAGIAVAWSATASAAGSDANAEIQSRLAEAHTAIVLVSSDFLHREEALLDVLEQRHREGLRVIPVIARATAYSFGRTADQSAPWIAHLTALPVNGRPLGSSRTIDEDLAEMTGHIRELVTRAKTPPVAMAARRPPELNATMARAVIHSLVRGDGMVERFIRETFPGVVRHFKPGMGRGAEADMLLSTVPAEEVVRQVCLWKMTGILPAQFEVLITRMEIPRQFLSGAMAPQLTRATEVLTFVAQRHQLLDLADALGNI